MAYLKARVRNGRLLLDVPSTLPDGSVVELEVVSVGSIEEPSLSSAGAFDEAEADTAVGPIISDDAIGSPLPKHGR